MYRIFGAAAFLGLFAFVIPAEVSAQDVTDGQNVAFVDRDGDGICDKFQNKGSDSKNRHRHRLKHRNKGKTSVRNFGYGHGKH